MQLKTEKMLARKEGGVGWMTFNNPARRNALSIEMQEAVTVILHDFRDDPEVRVVVMTGAGDKAFVSGADISEFEKRRSDAESIAEFNRIGAEANRAYGELGKPLIAMIRGFCMGGGLLTALQADIRVAAEDGVFGIPAARLGLGYGFSGTHKVVETIGAAAAREILFTGGRFPAVDALRWGLVNRVVPVEGAGVDGEGHRRRNRGQCATDREPAACVDRGVDKGTGGARPRHDRGDGGGVLQQRRLHRGATRLHGEAAAAVPGAVGA